MSKPNKLIVESLGFGNTEQKAVTLEDFDYEAFEVVLPAISFAIIADAYDFDTAKVLPENFTQADWNALDESEREEYRDAFRQTEGYDNWQDGFNPMMLYFWPLFMYGKNPAEVATLIDEFAPAVTLIELNQDHELHGIIDEDYALAFNGGGMNLSDHMALAYICAGSVPPLDVLRNGIDTIDDYKLPRVQDALKLALKRSEAAVRMDLDRVKKSRKLLTEKVTKNSARRKAA